MSDFITASVDGDRRLVFGWFYQSHDATGAQVVDHSGEFISDPTELESMAYRYVISSRRGGLDHAPEVTVGVLVESMVFTADKARQLGIPDGVLPTGWWGGFYIHDDDTWESVKRGERLAFSIHGSAIRKAVTA